MNARLSKFALTTSLLLCTGLALLFCAGQALSPGSALAETPPPPPGIPSLPDLPSSPTAVPAPAPSTVEAPPAPTAPAAPTTTSPAKTKKKPPVKRVRCKHKKHCAHHSSKRGRASSDETGASTSAVVGGVQAGATARFSTCYHAVWGVAYNMSSLESLGVWALPMMYDWATSRWTWSQSWTPADGITTWALTAYRPYGYVYVWFARYAGGKWQYSPEWVYVENELDNGFCS